MMRIADQTAGPIWLKFFEDTHGWSGVFYAKKIRILFLFMFNFFFLFKFGNPGPSSSTS